jgi:5'-methylthioadenosine phosphorylase
MTKVGGIRCGKKDMMKLPKIAIIGGSGLYALLENPTHTFVETSFGKTPRIEIGNIEGIEVAFLPRHSRPGDETVAHAIPPHKVNYRANIYGLMQLGVERILVSNAVGTLDPDLPPGNMCVVDQFLDMTKEEPYTFYDGNTTIELKDGRKISGTVHIDVSQPFCPELRRVLLKSAKTVKVPVRDGGVYVRTSGPRFETPAEINAYRILGATVVGMTAVPEAVLARELELCYASISMSTNFAAGMQQKISHEEVGVIFSQNIENVKKVLRQAVHLIPTKRACPCISALAGATA